MNEMSIAAYVAVPSKVLKTAKELSRIFVKIALQLEKETGVYVSNLEVEEGHTGEFHIWAEPIPTDVSKEDWRKVATEFMKRLKKELGIKELEFVFEEISEEMEYVEI